MSTAKKAKKAEDFRSIDVAAEHTDHGKQYLCAVKRRSHSDQAENSQDLSIAHWIAEI